MLKLCCIPDCINCELRCVVYLWKLMTSVVNYDVWYNISVEVNDINCEL